MVEETSTDAELIALARRGGPRGRGAFGDLVDRHHAWIVRLVRYLLAGSAAAEDVAQEAFVRAFLALPHYDERGDFTAWLRVIATRVAFNHRRSESTREHYHGMIKPPEACKSTVVERDALEHALSRISYASREILILRYVEELSIKEIANILHIGSSAAKMRLMRARVQLRRAYEELPSEDGS